MAEHASEDGAKFFPRLRQRNVGTRKRGPWSEPEHLLFLLGLKRCGPGQWRNIAREYVVTRTPTQVASHAQKYTLWVEGRITKKRPSMHDVVTLEGRDLKDLASQWRAFLLRQGITGPIPSELAPYIGHTLDVRPRSVHEIPLFQEGDRAYVPLPDDFSAAAASALGGVASASVTATMAGLPHHTDRPIGELPGHGQFIVPNSPFPSFSFSTTPASGSVPYSPSLALPESVATTPSSYGQPSAVPPFASTSRQDSVPFYGATEGAERSFPSGLKLYNTIQAAVQMAHQLRQAMPASPGLAAQTFAGLPYQPAPFGEGVRSAGGPFPSILSVPAPLPRFSAAQEALPRYSDEAEELESDYDPPLKRARRASPPEDASEAPDNGNEDRFETQLPIAGDRGVGGAGNWVATVDSQGAIRISSDTPGDGPNAGSEEGEAHVSAFQPFMPVPSPFRVPRSRGPPRSPAPRSRKRRHSDADSSDVTTPCSGPPTPPPYGPAHPSLLPALAPFSGAYWHFAPFPSPALERMPLLPLRPQAVDPVVRPVVPAGLSGLRPPSSPYPGGSAPMASPHTPSPDNPAGSPRTPASGGHMPPGLPYGALGVLSALGLPNTFPLFPSPPGAPSEAARTNPSVQSAVKAEVARAADETGSDCPGDAGNAGDPQEDDPENDFPGGRCPPGDDPPDDNPRYVEPPASARHPRVNGGSDPTAPRAAQPSEASAAPVPSPVPPSVPSSVRAPPRKRFTATAVASATSSNSSSATAPVLESSVNILLTPPNATFRASSSATARASARVSVPGRPEDPTDAPTSHVTASGSHAGVPPSPSAVLGFSPVPAQMARECSPRGEVLHGSLPAWRPRTPSDWSGPSATPLEDAGAPRSNASATAVSGLATLMAEATATIAPERGLVSALATVLPRGRPKGDVPQLDVGDIALEAAIAQNAVLGSAAPEPE